MAHTDWVPRREQDLVDLMAQWMALASDPAKIALFAWLAAECGKLLLNIENFLTARTDYEANKTPEKRLLKDELKEEAVDIMRDFANKYVRFNPKMTDADRLAMGIRPTDTTHTTHPAPTSQPDTDVLPTANHYEHRVHALNHAVGGAAKPADAYGVRYGWQVGGEKPASGEDLPKSHFTRKVTYVVVHSEADKAKTAYYATCYENSKGDQGRWSPVTEAIIA
jgi:hypothetical protein